jgi:solute carrier family 6 GABA transporter-like protein 1
MITGFIISIATLLVMIVGFIMPRYFDVFIPKHRRAEGTEPTVANELRVEHLEFDDAHDVETIHEK